MLCFGKFCNHEAVVVWEGILRKISNCLSGLVSHILHSSQQHLWLHCNELWPKSSSESQASQQSCKRKGHHESVLSAHESFLVLLSWQTQSESYLSASLLWLWVQASTSVSHVVLAAPYRASVGLAMLVLCLSLVILYGLHFPPYLMHLCLIRPWFCSCCLLSKYHYSLTKSKWLELKSLPLLIIILF